ncbi:MAG TPA: hypothetical protein VJZ00_21790 [Thermoanaerobaculia bacterium]|nr:hypothetical protein [Thermoanaerobaculia bacterium]
MTPAFGLLLLHMATAQPAAVTEVPVVDQIRRPCEATQDGPRRPTIVGRDGRFDQRCYDPKMEALRLAAEIASKRRILRTPFIGRRR